MTDPRTPRPVDRWREEAALHKRRGTLAPVAAILEACATEQEAFDREHALEALTLEQAAAESGYSYSALEKLVRRRELVNVGQKGAPRVRRGDLPRKPTHPDPAVNVDDLATLALRGRLAARGPGAAGW